MSGTWEVRAQVADLQAGNEIGDGVVERSLGEVHEAVLVVEGGVARILEGAAAVGARRLGEDQPRMGKDAVGLVEKRRALWQALEDVVTLERANAAVAGGDIGIHGINNQILVSFVRLVANPDRRAQSEASQTVALCPSERELLDELTVVDDGLLLNCGVDPLLALRVVRVYSLEVEAPLDLSKLSGEVEPTHQLLVVKELELAVVATNLFVGLSAKGADVVRRVPDVGDVVGGGRQGMAAVVLAAVDRAAGVHPPVSWIEPFA